MGKILLLLLGILLVYWVLRGYRRKLSRDDAPKAARREEDMVRCAHCGVHLPRSESLVAADRNYCSAEHQRAAVDGKP